VRLQRMKTRLFNTWFYLGIVILASLVLMGAITHQHDGYSSTTTYIFTEPDPDCVELEAGVELQAEEFLLRTVRKRLRGSASEDSSAPEDSTGTGQLAESLHTYSTTCFEQDSETAQFGSIDPLAG
jgi:hypothetical protein